MTVNLSQAGCAINSDRVAVGQRSIALQLFPPGHRTALEVEVAVVRWTHDQTFGVEFLDMRPEASKRLEAFLDGLSRGMTGKLA